MHIAIDASRATVARQTGTEHYALELIRHLIPCNAQRDTPHQLHLYFRDTPAQGLLPASEHVTQHVIPFARLWTHARFAAALWQTRPDVTFVPAHTLPFVFPGRSVVTVHDLGYRHFPQTHPRGQRLYLDVTTRYSAARASVVLADSQATAGDLQRIYGLSPQKIRVVYPGVEAPAGDSTRPVRDIYNLPQHYFLFIGTLQPRKNIQRLVQAFQQWQTTYSGEDTSIGLVLAGKAGWLFDPAWTAGVDNVHVTGYIDEADKAALLTQAEVLVFPSLYEGFGFPVLEAMHCGTPVLAANSSSLPELVDSAGLLVNPLDTDAIAAAMQKLATDKRLRDTLITRGHEQVTRFTWQRCASQTLEALEAATL
jgi:glycosyltransferase involved in cell wall biosynthesis